jgi:hypothetical protein
MAFVSAIALEWLGHVVKNQFDWSRGCELQVQKERVMNDWMKKMTARRSTDRMKNATAAVADIHECNHNR